LSDVCSPALARFDRIDTEARKQKGQEDQDGPDEATKKRGGRMTNMLRLLREELGDHRRLTGSRVGGGGRVEGWCNTAAFSLIRGGRSPVSGPGLGLGEWAGPTVRCLKSSTTIAIVRALGSRSQGEIVSADSY
jgi:hypothetical protein